jgi:hypothetical protein
MLKFEWNALRAGHRVVVHDPASADLTLLAGVVVTFDTHLARKGVNGVGIRVTDADGLTRILWPSYLAVHHDPHDPTEPCWRCQELTQRSAGTPPGSAPLPNELDATGPILRAS